MFGAFQTPLGFELWRRFNAWRLRHGTCRKASSWSSSRCCTGMDFQEAQRGTQHCYLWGCQAIYLIGGIPTPLKNMKVSCDDDIPNIWENKKCSKPPTRYSMKFYILSLWRCVCRAYACPLSQIFSHFFQVNKITNEGTCLNLQLEHDRHPRSHSSLTK